MVELEEGGDVLTLSIRDDGEGFEPESETSGFGLLGMRERVAMLQGRLMVDSRPGTGTRITAHLPALHPDGSAGYARRAW